MIWLIWGDVAGGFAPSKMHSVELHSLATVSKESRLKKNRSQKQKKKILNETPKTSQHCSPSNDLMVPVFPRWYHG